MRKTLLLLSFLSIALLHNAQDNLSFDERFAEAFQLTEENELNQALAVWVGLANEYPDNGNVNYRAGRAYLGSFRDKTKSLPYLEKAVNIGIAPNYNPISSSEKKAPAEAYYYLGKAQQLNYQLDDALENYKTFIAKASPKHFLVQEAQRSVETTENAKVLTKDSVQFDITHMGAVVNSISPDFSPVISVDENALFFTSRRLRPDSSNFNIVEATTGEYFEDIYVSYKNRDGEWQQPELLNINTMDHTATMNVSADGQTLFIYRDDNGDGNIYQSTLIGETWSEPEIMPSVINSGSWETHLALSADENTIYFVSNRKGGLGGRDIYRVVRLPNGDWSKALNVGPTINTPYEEDAVFISPDGNTLYFSSQGHKSMGGFDIFSTTKDENDEWTTPKNIGYPINTVDDDVFFVTSADGRRAYYSSVKATGIGEKDLYLIDLPAPEREVQLAVLKGYVTPVEGQTIPESTIIYVTNNKSGETKAYTPRARDGVFVAILPPCVEYNIDYRIEGKSIYNEVINVPCESSYQEINKELLLDPVNLDKSKVMTIEKEEDALTSDKIIQQKKEEVGDSLKVTTSDGTSTFTSTTEKGSTIFDKFYNYNEKDVSLDDSRFNIFMNDVAEIIRENGSIEVEITGSASKVPTSTYKSNQVLAGLRAEEARKKFLEGLRDREIESSKVTFSDSKELVQGPDYKNDARTGKEKYGKYQFIKIVAK